MYLSMPLSRLFNLLLFPLLIAALYQDEAYEIDYQHALTGAPIPGNTFFHQPSTTSKATLIYTLSERNVLGAINPKDGAVVWRQQLGNSTEPALRPGFLKAVNQTNLLYTAVGNRVSSWDAADGRLVAEWHGQGQVKSLELHETDPLVIFEGPGVSTLVRLNAANAKMMWEVKDASGEIPIAMTTSSQYLYYLTLMPKLLKGYQIKVTQVEPFSAQPQDQLTLDSHDEVSSAESIIHIGGKSDTPFIAWVDKTLKTLKINVLGYTAINTIAISKHGGVAPERVSIHAPVSASSPGHFLVAYHAKGAHWAEVHHIDKAKGGLKKAYDLPKLDGPGAFAISEVAGQVYFVRHSETEMTLISSESHAVLERWPISTKSSTSALQKLAARYAIVEVVPKGPSKHAVRSMLTLESDDVVLIRNGAHDWTRSESLAGISVAAWANIPEQENLAKALESEIHANFVSAYIHRVTRHLHDLRYLPDWLESLPQRILSSFGLGNAPLIEDLTADPFGFRKLVLVATRSGRIAALDSGSNGQVLWNIQAVEVASGETWIVKQIHVIGDMAWFLADDASQSIFVTLTGEIKTDWPFDDAAKGSRLLPVSTSGSSALVSVSKDGVPSFKSAGAGGDQSITLVTQRPDRSLSGWLSNAEEAVKTWDFVPPKDFDVAVVAARPEHDPVASIGRALGDRNVLYKYLSQNLLLVVSLKEKTSEAVANLLDTVSGQVLHTAHHDSIDVSKGVSATFSENWFAYVLQTDPVLANTETAGFSKSSLLTITELYESPIPNDRGPLGLNTNVSSLGGANYAPHVVSASFIIPATLKGLSTTSTRQGITPRSILAYVPSLAAMVAIPLAILAPRRPVGRDPTADEREEGLFKYLPVVDIAPTWTISHKRELLGVNGVISTPSDMESTSLVFSYGDLDIFGSRYAPIGTFDMLAGGFNKMQLILTVVALAIGTGVLAPMVRKKQIDGLWRT